MDRRIVLLPILLTTPSLAFAIGSTFQMASTINGIVSPDGDTRYDRYTEDSFGAKVTFRYPLFDEYGNYLVAPGESWTWTWERLDQPQLIAGMTATYLGGDGMCWSHGSCGALGWLYGGIPWKCIPEGTYRVSVTHNNAPLGSGDFRPTRFKPAVWDVAHADYLKPAQSAKGEGQITDYAIVVTDDLQCDQPLEDVEVKLKTHVVENDLSHAHLSKDYGTGKFQASPGFDASVTDMPPEITGSTNANGMFVAKYQAKEHGIYETFVAELKRPATDADPEILGPRHESKIHIQVPDLVEITGTNAPVVFADGKSCPHEPLPHWLTQNSLARMNAVAAGYQYVTGRKLSLNDASVPYGGVIDNKLKNGGGRDAACHVSHRRGNDIDLNKIDSGGVDVLTADLLLDGEETALIEWLTYLVARFRGERLDEETIHFRFPN